MSSSFDRTWLLAVVVLSLLITSPAVATIFRVDGASGNDNNNGSSWPLAVKTLQRGLQLASADQNPDADQIWVAAGTYYPDVGPGEVDSNSPLATFQMLRFVTMFGGFAGDEQFLEDRDIVANETILSGDIDGNPATFLGFNSRHVLTYVEATGLEGSNPTAVLDGFTITAGATSSHECDDPLDTFNATGGGVFLDGGINPLFPVSFLGPTFRNCKFVGNRAVQAGGAIGAINMGVGVFNCTFDSNEALGACDREDVATELPYEGGGAVSAQGEIQIVGSTFIGNVSGGRGGALEARESLAGLHSAKIVNAERLSVVA